MRPPNSRLRAARATRRTTLGTRRAVLLAVVACVALGVSGSGCSGGGFLPDAPLELTPTLGGRVTDALTDAPIAGAVVTFQGKSVESGGDGMYFIDHLATGAGRAEARRSGYVTAVREVVIGDLLVNIADFELRPLS